MTVKDANQPHIRHRAISQTDRESRRGQVPSALASGVSWAQCLCTRRRCERVCSQRKRGTQVPPPAGRRARALTRSLLCPQTRTSSAQRSAAILAAPLDAWTACLWLAVAHRAPSRRRNGRQ
eukprot:5474772-Pleurochrysis_carterae.AAC.4